MQASTQELTKDIIQWDIRNWSKALVHWENSIDWSQVQKGLELGGRQGGISLWLASKGKEVICSDLKDVRSSAEPLHQKYNVVKHIQYQDIDATDIPYENHFDVIVFKSIIGGIGSHDNIAVQRKVFQQIHKALKPGGRLLFAENLVASPLHAQLRKRFTSWGDRWRYITVDELQSFLEPFKSYDIKTTGVLATFGRSENQRNILAHVDQLLLNHLCPKKWRYISYGVAMK